MIKQYVLCSCVFLIVSGCMNFGIEPIEKDSKRWNNFMTLAENVEIQYKLPPRSSPYMRNIPKVFVNFSDTNCYTIVNGHKWSNIGSFGYEYNPKERFSVSRFELFMIIGRVDDECHVFNLGDWIFNLCIKVVEKKGSYFLSYPKKRGDEVLIGTNRWYHQVGYNAIDLCKTTKTSNIIISDLYAKMLNSNIYLIVVSEYVKGIKNIDHSYRKIMREIVSNIQVINEKRTE